LRERAANRMRTLFVIWTTLLAHAPIVALHHRQYQLSHEQLGQSVSDEQSVPPREGAAVSRAARRPPRVPRRRGSALEACAGHAVDVGHPPRGRTGDAKVVEH
jgi:hypothetical protein